MEVKKKPLGRAALGRGLSALISTPVSTTPVGGNAAVAQIPPGAENISASPTPVTVAPSASDEGVRFISIEQITNNPAQPRKEFTEAELAELTESIRGKGLLQPVLVRPSTNPGSPDIKYEIVAGERRWRAAKRAGLTQVPAIIRNLDERETLEFAIIENVQRQNLTPIEEAQGYQRLATEFSLSQNEIAERVGKDRASIANFLRLLKLPAEVLELLKKGELTMGHAKAILTIKEPTAQVSLARKAVKEALSVRELEAIVSRVVVLDAGHRITNKDAEANKNKEGERGVSFPDVIDRMRNKLGTKVLIKHHNSGRGRIEIEYFSEQELDRIVEQICK
jgi:ParB family transcriptional regulator, chromosome partitioning protein